MSMYILLNVDSANKVVARYGAGYHAWEIRKPEYYNWLKVSYIIPIQRLV